MFPLRDDVQTRSTPWVVYALIALNVAAFLAQSFLSPEQIQGLFYLFGIVPARFFHPEWAARVGYPAAETPLAAWGTVFTALFLHAGLFHLVANLWTLYIFGPGVEDRVGPLRFLGIYALAGLGAGLLHLATNPNSTIPTVGASGAIAGVMGAYLLLYPLAQLIVVLPILFVPLIYRVPAITYFMAWFLIQVFSGTLSLAAGGAVGGVAWWAHIGGFLAGVLGLLWLLRLEPGRGSKPWGAAAGGRETGDAPEWAWPAWTSWAEPARGPVPGVHVSGVHVPGGEIPSGGPGRSPGGRGPGGGGSGGGGSGGSGGSGAPRAHPYAACSERSRAHGGRGAGDWAGTWTGGWADDWAGGPATGDGRRRYAPDGSEIVRVDVVRIPPGHAPDF